MRLSKTFRTPCTICLSAPITGTGHARPTRAAISLAHVVAGKGMAFRAVGLQHVRESALLGGVQKVLALGADEQMRRIHTLPVVAGMADHTPCRDRAFVQLPRKAMGGKMVTANSHLPVTIWAKHVRPRPAAIRFLNLRPEFHNAIHVRTAPFGIDQYKGKCTRNLQLHGDRTVAKHPLSVAHYVR